MKKQKKAVKRGAPKKVAKVVRKIEPKPVKGAKRVTIDKLAINLERLSKEEQKPKIEITVRNVYHDGQYLPALCFRPPGTLHVPCVAGDPVMGVYKFTINAMQHDKSTILQRGYGALVTPYTPEMFANHMRRIAGTAPITPEARALLLPYAPDMPRGPVPATLPAAPDAAQPVSARMQPRTGSRAASSGPGRTSGKELVRALAEQSKLPPEKVRAKLRAAGLRAPYTDEEACRKALDLD